MTGLDVDALVAVAQLPTSCTPGGPGLTEALHNAERFRETFDPPTVLALIAELRDQRDRLAATEAEREAVLDRYAEREQRWRSGWS